MQFLMQLSGASLCSTGNISSSSNIIDFKQCFQGNTGFVVTCYLSSDHFLMSFSYGLSKEEAKSYVLCDTIGSTGNHQWRPEGFRVVGDNERPLLLQSLWKPREGLARRFEIQRKSWVEERTSKDKDTITAGRVSACSFGAL